ncbi:uncharacterized protein LOC143145338 [Ptiloglossa arizonensis]|uniref:uncharacterized protein LOC143145338 n=1 Tax=Ptiloglossa arizonensis TaxID=3350558 RepID=UPI003F9F7CCD
MWVELYLVHLHPHKKKTNGSEWVRTRARARHDGPRIIAIWCNASVSKRMSRKSRITGIVCVMRPYSIEMSRFLTCGKLVRIEIPGSKAIVNIYHLRTASFNPFDDTDVCTYNF